MSVLPGKCGPSFGGPIRATNFQVIFEAVGQTTLRSGTCLLLASNSPGAGPLPGGRLPATEQSLPLGPKTDIVTACAATAFRSILFLCRRDKCVDHEFDAIDAFPSCGA